jgi:acyl-coenzyme A synthetase/AMP-(fatty) acid ligase
MNGQDQFSVFQRQILSGPADPTAMFIHKEYSYGDVYRLAAAIRSALSSSTGQDDAVCLYTDHKALIAGAVIAALAGGPRLILPHAFSDQTLRDIKEATPCRWVLTDRAIVHPEGMEVISLKELNAVRADFPPGMRDPDDPFLMLFTGGSTGRARMWSKTPRNVFAEARYLAEAFAFVAQDVFLSTVPPQHIYGLLFSVLLPLITGAQVLPGVYVFPREIWAAAVKYSVTVLISVPVHYRVLTVNGLEKNFLRFAFSSAGMLDEHDAVSFHQKTGLGIHEIYGSTETGGIAVRCRADGQKSWKPFDNVAWKITEGRLSVQSEFISSELERDRDGFFTTGDRVSANGHEQFILVGRVDGIVKIGGKRVDLKEVESKLKQIPGVSDAAVMSFPSPHGRQNDIAALVVSSLTDVQIRRTLSTMLEPYAVPKRIRVTGSIPVTAAGKYDREAMERMFR